jgi:hypothetical protein
MPAWRCRQAASGARRASHVSGNLGDGFEHADRQGRIRPGGLPDLVEGRVDDP